MSGRIPVRCPVCRREHLYAPHVYPCACGTPVSPPVVRGADPLPITHVTWDDDWVTVRCESCGRLDQWPQPELGCDCGTALHIPVHPAASGPAPGHAPLPLHIPLPPTAPAPRPAFHPVTIRTARDAVQAAALYLRWLGYKDIRRAEQRSGSGVGLSAPGLRAQVEPTTRAMGAREVECVWLAALNESSVPVCFSLAGYTDDARTRADGLAIPLFVLDLTGTPQPVNSPADELISTGA
ncbi:hypothetical protein ACIBI4_32550 [Streptomyces sp. NPDC050418]|uniref:hypothetical protein n=1 Tax=Streptomyces sp. NPDC050418 TaxID=3365612 RepID=UPI00379E41ED